MQRGSPLAARGQIESERFELRPVSSIEPLLRQFCPLPFQLPPVRLIELGGLLRFLRPPLLIHLLLLRSAEAEPLLQNEPAILSEIAHPREVPALSLTR